MNPSKKRFDSAIPLDFLMYELKLIDHESTFLLKRFCESGLEFSDDNSDLLSYVAMEQRRPNWDQFNENLTN